MADRIVVMRDGVIQQIGTPSQVYAHPATAFVATFVGSPPMNLFPGEIVAMDGGRTFRGAVTWGRDEAVRSGLPDGPVTLGIRPEHIEISSPGRPGAVTGTVALVENVGADAYLSVSVGSGQTVWVRTNAQTTVGEGAQVALLFDAPHVRWFDAAGHRIRQEIA